MNNKFDIIFLFDHNLNNDLNTYIKLIELYHLLDSEDQKSILLDFAQVNFLSANLLAVLGCCVENTIVQRGHRVAINEIHPKIKDVMRRNGFNKYFAWDDLEDKYHSTMDYATFKATTDNIFLKAQI